MWSDCPAFVQWIENLEKKGRISFSLSQLEEESGVPWGYNCLASS